MKCVESWYRVACHDVFCYHVQKKKKKVEEITFDPTFDFNVGIKSWVTNWINFGTKVCWNILYGSKRCSKPNVGSTPSEIVMHHLENLCCFPSAVINVAPGKRQHDCSMQVDTETIHRVEKRKVSQHKNK